ncbi:hypothetical protein [Amycolatopsis magusensis]|uniref:hypothetical protein n=1 Tax=Amycolatopsis magusensis TaxID=882444 RepID=UPI0024A8E25D|nr:hypothetical protein [Amycolatopsis magusensis]MDI5977977.1 hypothetical protein [Amycolatopsis magusensis]
MSTSNDNMSPQRLYVTWYRCIADHLEHAVTDEEFARGLHRGAGWHRALCGHRLYTGSCLLPPARPCPRCLFLVTAPRRPAVPHRPTRRPRTRSTRRCLLRALKLRPSHRRARLNAHGDAPTRTGRTPPVGTDVIPSAPTGPNTSRPPPQSRDG